jgi:hypothetical protein
MKRVIRARWIICCISLLAFVLINVVGCAESQFQKKSTAKPESNAEKEVKGEIPIYYDFNDVLIPGELKLEREASFIYQTSGLTAGVLVFSGRVELSSLIDFFKNNMSKDNWQIISSIKSERNMMLFKKEKRWCVVSIKEKELFDTETEIWVAPIIGDTESGLLK